MTPEAFDRDEIKDETQIGDFFAPLLAYRRLIWRTTVAATVLAILGGAIYFFVQPAAWSIFVEFRPAFKGIAAGEYPNKLPFASSDIVDPTVLDQVYDKNHAEQFCSREEFRSGFVVDETSTELQFLDMDYQSRLADTRLSSVDRERLQNEYRARRLAMPVRYRLTWIRSVACRSVPSAVATKALGEVLQTWAEDADKRRGVLKLRVAVLTPAVFDQGTVNAQSLLIRADLIRAALVRIINNIREVELLPGAELIRTGADHVSFVEVRARLEDLVQVHLDPLVAVAGRGLGTDAVHWAEESLAEALVQQQAAEERAEAYSTALREYSGVGAAPAAASAQRSQPPSDVQTQTQIDRTFIDKIVDLSEANTTFRQELTRSMILAKVAAVDTTAKVEHYKQLLATLKAGTTSSSLTAAEVDQRLTQIVIDGKEQVKQFGALYDEFSRSSLRSASAMYQIERPPQVQVLKSFTARSLLLLILGVFFGTPVILAIGCLAYHFSHRLTRRPLGA